MFTSRRVLDPFYRRHPEYEKCMNPHTLLTVNTRVLQPLLATLDTVVLNDSSEEECVLSSEDMGHLREALRDLPSFGSAPQSR